MKYPAGFHTRPGFVKIAVEFPHQLFAEIITMAMKENKAFGPMVVELVKCGKLCLDENDQHEPETALT